MKFRRSIIAITGYLVLSAPQQTFCTQTEPTTPCYKLNRAGEDYRYLQDRTVQNRGRVEVEAVYGNGVSDR